MVTPAEPTPAELLTPAELFGNSLDPAVLTELRRCVQTGTPFGNDRFREQIEKVLKVKVGYSGRGRPRKQGEGGA